MLAAKQQRPELTYPQLDKELDLPVPVVFLYDIFWSVRGKDGLSWAELKAYCDLYGLNLEGRDLYLLNFMDLITTNHINEKTKKDQEKLNRKNKPQKRGGRR